MDTSSPQTQARMDHDDDSIMMVEQPMSVFSLDDRRCPCLLCVQGPPAILQRDSVAWTSIIRVAFYVLHTIYPDLPYLSMKTHVSPYILRHWQTLGIDKKGDNVKWKKHILDAIWHGDSFFESGTPVLKQTGVWRLINPKADPWLDSPSSSPLPRRKNLLQKKVRSSPAFSVDDLPPQEFATSEPVSPTIAQRNLSSSSPNLPQALPHISHLLRHVDDYWNSRGGTHKSPPLHRRATNMSYSPYRSPPLESRFATSPPLENRFATSPLESRFATSPPPESRFTASPPSPTPMAISPAPPSPVPTVNLIPAINTIPAANQSPNVTPHLTPAPTITLDRPVSLSPQLPPSPSPPTRMQSFSQMSPFQINTPAPLSPFSSTPMHLQACATDGLWSTHNASPTRALHMLPCVSSLFQPAPLLPSIFPTS